MRYFLRLPMALVLAPLFGVLFVVYCVLIWPFHGREFYVSLEDSQ